MSFDCGVHLFFGGRGLHNLALRQNFTSKLDVLLSAFSYICPDGHIYACVSA